MDEQGVPAGEVFKILKSAQMRDLEYSEGRILGSMCTHPNDLAKEVFSMFIETNLGDSGLFKGTKDLESRAIAQIAGLIGMEGALGNIVTGGTEANVLAMWAARNLKKKKKVILPETAHFSLDKACNLLGLEIVRAVVDEHKCTDINDVESKVDDETCAIVGIAGTTEYGTVDKLEELSRIARQEDVFFHVDAAFGGFVLPFLKDLGYSSGFNLGKVGVDSVTVDPHKMGFVPIPCGCILFRSESALDAISTNAPYLSQKKQHTLVGTRTGAAAAAAFAVFKFLGREGYRNAVKECMENTFFLYQGLSKLGVQVMKPTMNILVFKGEKNLYKGLLKRGWKLSKTRNGWMRIIVMPHVTKTRIEEFLIDVKAVSGE
jgi:tyrosine decarboxylase/aspartate 1-decarboxylase